MYLLIDIGNSRIKWGTGQGRSIKSFPPVSHGKDFDKLELLQAWQLLERPEKVAISSVVSSSLTARINTLLESVWPGVNIVHARSRTRFDGVRNSYSEPEKLGVDRWLAMLALNRYYPLPACIVDCGTAITVDFLADDGRHLGGLIAPGLTLMKSALTLETENLDLYQQTFPVGLANNTGAAIQNGALFAAVGLIESIIVRQGGQFNLVLTGGDSGLVADHLSLDCTLVPDLVLQGLAVFLDD